jgi:signal peptidase I
MYPAAQDGDLLLAWRLSDQWSVGDMVIFRLEGKTHLGRIAAAGGDIVMLNDSGMLLVNGSIQNGPTLFPTYARENALYPQRIPERSVCILGDHRTQSRDSRDYGYIPVKDIVGKVIAIVRTSSL